GFRLETCSGALGENELIEKIRDVHVLGIRSKTQITDRVLGEARRLLAVGAFCIGTNQIQLEAANRRGVPVFNAPFSNTRSVAELVIAEIVALARRLIDRSREMHEGRWRKVATSCYEVRGKTLGIIGYGHIGTQVGVLAEAFGMQVVFYDILPRLPIGNNRQAESMQAVLAQSDFVTLHVPETPATRHLIGEAQLAQMKPGAYLLNLSRGTVVDLAALAAALRAGKLAGASVDVFPEEPEGNTDSFATDLHALPNVILTPHVGGSTEEAQEAIGREVMTALIKFVNTGATTGSVNFPQIEPPPLRNRHRLLNIHQNVPGVLSNINRIVSDVHANIESQILATDPTIGYLLMDLNHEVSEEVRSQMTTLPTNIRTRVLY
ncbi:MAG TPA: phosphoglycerate dehydrogenase, partial [Polyangiaceae bacterium]|nr:phosphoglycerate dehydrogenase [Polyangiaceae bacterium]